MITTVIMKPRLSNLDKKPTKISKPNKQIDPGWCNTQLKQETKNNSDN